MEEMGGRQGKRKAREDEGEERKVSRYRQVHLVHLMILLACLGRKRKDILTLDK
jgi:hypothetical protein